MRYTPLCPPNSTACVSQASSETRGTYALVSNSIACRFDQSCTSCPPQDNFKPVLHVLRCSIIIWQGMTSNFPIRLCGVSDGGKDNCKERSSCSHRCQARASKPPLLPSLPFNLARTSIEGKCLENHLLSIRSCRDEQVTLGSFTLLSIAGLRQACDIIGRHGSVSLVSVIFFTSCPETGHKYRGL